MRLMKDSAVLEKMYAQNLNYYKELTMYILAGKQKLQEVREGKLRDLEAKAAASGLPEDAQEAKDLDSKCNRFEKKLHDLELTRTISLQTAPQIRLVQNNDTLMVEKIQTTIVNTIPLWKSQIVIALGLHRLFGLVLGGQPGVVVHGVADDVAIVVLGVQAGLVVIGVRIGAVASGASMIGKDDLVCWFPILLNAPITNGKSPLFIISHRYRKRVNTGVILDTV